MNAKVFTTVDGGRYKIGSYGEATRLWDAEAKAFVDVGVPVPDDVADQIEREISGHSHYEEGDDPDTPQKTKRHAVRFGRGPSTHLRLERDPAKKPHAHASAHKDATPTKGGKE